MLVLHISDTHLGKRQYNQDFREDDVYSTFTQLIDIAIKEHVDAIIHSGDLFDVNEPPPRAILHAIKELKRLKDNGIKFVSIAGDHDTPKRKNSIFPQRILEEYELLTLLDGKSIKINDVEIHGISHKPNIVIKDLKNKLISAKPESNKSILLLHQGLRELLPFNGSWQIEVSDLPSGFSVYAVGHFHSRYKQVLPNGGILEIAGSPDIMREEEIEDYEKYKKGATLIDFSKKEVEIQYINTDIRPQIVTEINTDKLDSEVDKVMRQLSVFKQKKPILHVILKGQSIRRDLVIKKLSRLNEVVEYWRIYKDDTYLVKEDKDTNIKYSSIDELILNYLTTKAGYKKEEAELVLQIIKEDDEETLIKLLKTFAGV